MRYNFFVLSTLVCLLLSGCMTTTEIKEIEGLLNTVETTSELLKQKEQELLSKELELQENEKRLLIRELELQEETLELLRVSEKIKKLLEELFPKSNLDEKKDMVHYKKGILSLFFLQYN